MRGTFVAATFGLLTGCGLAENGLLFQGGEAGTGTPTMPGAPDATVPTGDASTGGPTMTSDATLPEGEDATLPDVAEDAGAAGSLDACPPPATNASLSAVTQIAPPPAINGDLSEWGCGPWIDLNETNAAYVREFDAGPGQTLSGQYAVRWDATNLYVAAHIVVPILAGDNATPYDNDAIELYVSGDSPLAGNYDKSSHQYIVDWHNVAVDYGSNRKSTPNPPNFASQVRVVADGWQIEAAIGWQALVAKSPPTPGTSIGFDIQFDDGDGTTIRKAVLAMIAPHPSACGCSSCCCGQAADLPDCDTLCFGGVTLE